MAKLEFRLLERMPSQWGELWVHVLYRDASPGDGIEAVKAT